ncbi:hypothetical protein KSF73_15595 [Burkholderiaceae bacterium DAT-1]|nr:hypothetical protein [Burkholderiaceae bacterium DAT-1]
MLRKTDAGIAALQVREGEHKLPMRKRTLLLQIDGSKSLEEIKTLSVSLGNNESLVDELISQQFIELVSDGNDAPTILAEGEPTQLMPAQMDIADTIASNEELATPASKVSSKLPEHLQAVAMDMRNIVEQHLGLKGMLLRRRIGNADTEVELRQALLALTEALTKVKGHDESRVILHSAIEALPILGVARQQSYR